MPPDPRTALPDVAVLGAGAIGLSIAWRLLGRGARVRVYDRGPAARAATWASAGLLAASAGHGPNDHETPLDALCRRGLARWPAFAAELEAASGVDVGLRTEGTLVVALHAMDAERERAAAAGRTNPTRRWLSYDEVAALEPMLAGSVSGAWLCPGDHQVDTRRLTAALREAVRRAGGIVHEHTDAALDLDGARPVVRTPTGDRTADVVVLAAGAWSGAITGAPALPVRPVIGQMLALGDRPDGPWLRHVVFTPDVYLAPRRDGRLLVGATVEERGFDTTVTAGGVRALLDGACRALPALASAPLAGTWAGVRPGTPDDAPLLGGLTDRLVVATGHYRNGILLTPLTADLIADVVCGHPAPEWAAPFRPDRFAETAYG